MSLTPLFREDMRSFKAQKDKEGHNLKIDAIVGQIYENAIYFAEINVETAYRTNITHNMSIRLYGSARHVLGTKQLEINKEYLLKNMSEILMRLKGVFPDCSVEYKKASFVTGRDGKEYDISTLDNKLRPFIDTFIDTNDARTDEYIVIDWS